MPPQRGQSPMAHGASASPQRQPRNHYAGPSESPNNRNSFAAAAENNGAGSNYVNLRGSTGRVNRLGRFQKSAFAIVKRGQSP